MLKHSNNIKRVK